MSQFLKQFIENKKWKQIKKSDWIVLALAGVLLLVISLPNGGETRRDDGVSETDTVLPAQKEQEAGEEAYVRRMTAAAGAETAGT